MRNCLRSIYYRVLCCGTFNEVVISIGYSELTPEDQLLHDVFERADQMMYKRKQQLKQMGAPTRSDG